MNRFTTYLLSAMIIVASYAALAQDAAPRVTTGASISTAVEQVAPTTPPATSPSVAPQTTKPSEPAGSSVMKIEPVAPLKVITESNPPPGWTYFVPIVGPVISGILAFLGAWLGLRIAQKNTLTVIRASQQTNDASIWQKANEMELRDIQSKLDSFYFPFMQLARANKEIAQDLRHRQGDPDYRLLMKLFDKMWVAGLSPADKKMVDIVCENASILEGFIAQKAGSVDMELLPYLSRVSAHFRMLHLAHKGELGGDPERFRSYVYPNQIDRVFELEVSRLKERVQYLRQNPGSRPEPLKPLVIPDDLRLPPWVDPERNRAPVATKI